MVAGGCRELKMQKTLAQYSPLAKNRGDLPDACVQSTSTVLSSDFPREAFGRSRVRR